MIHFVNPIITYSRWVSSPLLSHWNFLTGFRPLFHRILMKWWSHQAVAEVFVCLRVRMCVSLWTIRHMPTQLCSDMNTKAWPDVLAICLWHRLCMCLCVCVRVWGITGQHIVLMTGVVSDITPLHTFESCVCARCARVKVCLSVRWAYKVGFIQHFPFYWHLSPQGKCLCVFAIEMENVVAVLIWSCSRDRVSAFAIEWIRVLLHQRYGQAGWITCSSIGTHTSALV